MRRNERICHRPTADHARRSAATPPARADSPLHDLPLPLAPPTSLVLLIDHLGHAACSRREALILLAGIALLATPAAASQGSPGQSRRRRLEARLAGDARLDRKIAVTAWSESLEDLLARLSAEMGVTLRFEGRDVGDQRVNVVLKEQPLSRALVLLAEALDLYWRRERKAPDYRYVLFQDTASQKREQAILDRVRARFEEGIHRMVASLKLTPQEIEELRPTSHWWARHLENSTRRLAIEITGRLSPAYLEHALRTGRVEIPFASLSPGDRARVLRFVEAMNRDRQRVNQERNLPADLHIIGDMTRPGGHVSISVLGGIPVGWGSFLDLGVEAADGRGSYLGVSPGCTDAETRSFEEELLPPGFERERRNPPPDGGPRVALPRTPWEARTFLPWEEVLKAVAEAADLQIIGDSYLYYWWEENSILPNPSTLRDRPLAEVLDAVAPPYFYVWRRDGDVFLFRHRNGFVEKRHNVPERDIRRWRARLKAEGRLTLEDLAALSLLSDRQHGMLHHRGIPTRAARSHRKLLRLYAALTLPQRTRLERTGLSLGELKAPQVELLRAWKPAAVADAGARLWLRREPGAVLFTLMAGDRATVEERVPLERGTCRRWNEA